MNTHCTLVKDDALAVWQLLSADTDLGQNGKLTHITVQKTELAFLIPSSDRKP